MLRAKEGGQWRKGKALGQDKQQRRMRVGKQSAVELTPRPHSQLGEVIREGGRYDVDVQLSPRSSSCPPGAPAVSQDSSLGPSTSAGPPWSFPPSFTTSAFQLFPALYFLFLFLVRKSPWFLWLARRDLSVRASTSPFDKSQEFFPPEEGGKRTAHLLSDPSPSALWIQLSCDSEDKKRTVSPQCSQWTELCTYRGWFRPTWMCKTFRFLENFLKSSEIVKLPMAAWIICDLH